MRRTKPLTLVAAALLAAPDGKHWGYELSRQSGIPTGQLYPMLTKMLQLGWLTDGWEDPNSIEGRPPRRYYELTELGRRELAELVNP